MKKHKALPPRRDTRITSQYVPADGSIVISVARGWTGAGEVLYRLESEKLAGIVEDRKELAVLINNLGLLVLAQLTGFNLAETLEELPKAIAKWGHIDVEALKMDDVEDALRIAHSTHGQHPEEDSEGAACECTGTTAQTVCSDLAHCYYCHQAEHNEGRDSSRDGTSDDDGTAGPSSGVSGESDFGRIEESPALAPDEQRA